MFVFEINSFTIVPGIYADSIQFRVNWFWFVITISKMSLAEFDSVSKTYYTKETIKLKSNNKCYRWRDVRFNTIKEVLNVLSDK